MEISEYDEYIPEKELKLNFTIPRRKPEEISDAMQSINPNTPFYAQMRQAIVSQGVQKGLSYGQPGYGYTSLPGAASQASAHTNSKPPVAYGVPPPPPPEVDVSTKPPLLPASNVRGNTSYGNLMSKPPTMNAPLQRPNTANSYANRDPTVGRNFANNNFFQRRNPDGWSGENRGYNADQRDFNPNERSGGFQNESNRPMGGLRQFQNRNWENDFQRRGNWNNDWNDDFQGGDFEDGPSFQQQNSNRRFDMGKNNEWDDGYDEPRDFVDGPPIPVGRGRGGFGVNRGGMRGGFNNRPRGFNDQEKNLSDNFQAFTGGQTQTLRPWNSERGYVGYRNEEFENNQGFTGDRNNWRGGGRGGSRGRGFGGKRTFGDTFKDKSNFGPPVKKEKQKSPADRTPVKIKDLTDETLPKELRELFQPLYCKLCQLQMNSNIMAKLHYSSKNHEKKIRKFLLEHAEKTGEPVHPRAVVTEADDKQKKEEDKNPKYFHCEVCDLPLTGKLHAESHYMGKSHNAVVMGRKAPSGKGHYDENGKWVRHQTEKVVVTPAEGDNFGLDFRKKNPEGVVEDKEGSGEAKPLGEFSCSICKVTCTAQEQMNMHFSGAKHRKKLKAMGVSPESFTLAKDDKEEVNNEEVSADNEEGEERNDFSKYKTPSGHYYCGKCNLTLNSETQLKSHLTSKNHMKKSTAQNKETATVQ